MQMQRLQVFKTFEWKSRIKTGKMNLDANIDSKWNTHIFHDCIQFGKNQNKNGAHLCVCEPIENR